MDSFVDNAIHEIREKVGTGKVLCALSGGVDSSVAGAAAFKSSGKTADLCICGSWTAPQK